MIPPDTHQHDPATAGLQKAVRLVRLLWLKRLVMLMSLGVSLSLGGLYYATAPRIFEAESQILVVDAQRESLNTSLAAGRDELTAMATYEKLISSPLVLQAAARLLEPATRTMLGSQEIEVVADRITDGLRIRGVRQTNLVDLRFRAAEPTVTAAVLAAVVQAYATFMDEAHRGKAGTLVETLHKEKEAVDLRLQDKQAEFLDVRQRVGDLGVKTDGKVVHPLVERAIQLNATLIDTQKKRLALQATHQSLLEALERGADLRQSLMAIEESLGKEVFLDSMGLSERNKDTRVSLEKQMLEDRAQLDTLLQYYGDNHPKVIERRKKIEQVTAYLRQFDSIVPGARLGENDAQLAQAVEQILRQRLEATVRHEQWLQQSFDQAKAESAGFASEIAKLDILEHDLRWLRELRNTILGQIASIDLRQEHGGVKTTVVREAAVPASPVSPRLTLTILLCTAAGIAAGLGIVVVTDALDDKVRSPAALEHDIGLRPLATIGTLADEADEGRTGLESAHMWRPAADAASEGFRTLRTVIVMSDKEMRRVSVSSAEPGDGKTTMSVNLAITYHQAGKRVLLIDGDMRKPGLTTLIDKRSLPGLAELLADTAPVTTAAPALICRSGDVPIDIIPSGRRPANPGELLLGGPFADLLGWAETVYDLVIVDSPPVLAGTDAAAIGRVCDGTLLVVRPEKNSRHILRKAAETLQTFGARILGAVINGVDGTERGYGYGYGYGYGDGQPYGEPGDGDVAEPGDDDERIAGRVGETRRPDAGSRAA